jgi:KamA family protein
MTQLQQTTQTSCSGFPCPNWQSLLHNNVTKTEELCKILQLPISVVSSEAIAIQPLNVTRDYLSRIECGNPHDPLLLQILPRREELETVPGFLNDPLDEVSYLTQTTSAKASLSKPGCPGNESFSHNPTYCLPTLQKYPGRMLILASDHCAAHCRFCFRRHLSKKKPNADRNHRVDPKHIRYTTCFLKNNEEISDVREIILSGGDPLMLDDTELDTLLNYIKDVHPGNRVRLHTRMPVMLPERVTPQLVALLRDFRCHPVGGVVYVVLHINHANELSDKVVHAIHLIVDAGIPVLSQTVLLRHVNDRFETLYDLFDKLANHRIIPYYLHQLDRVQGTAHFEVPTTKGQVLISKLGAALPGYAVPRFVREISGESKKMWL